MKLGIMQPYFLPYIGYFQLIKAVEKYIIYDDVQYIKGGWINRNRMLLEGKDFMFNLLLSGASSNKLINEIEVAPSQLKLLKTIESAYKKAPCFNEVYLLIEKIINYSDKNLGKYIGNSITQIADYLGLKTEFIYSSDIEKKNELRAEEKVLHLCGLLKATEYFNAIGGQELYSKEEFKQKNIDLKFLKTKLVEYKQFNNEFVPFLSILDVLMFNSPIEINGMLDNYELING